MLIVSVIVVIRDVQGPRFYAANFAKFRGAICEILRPAALLYY